MTSTPTVLVLCTGNSCRSQMGEALLNHDLAGTVRALSAGTRPQPKVADGAIEALKRAGLPTEGLHPKDVDAVLGEPIDLVVTVCDNAKEACPVFPRPVKSIHLPFHDPHGEPLDSFLAVPILIQALFNSALAYWLNRKVGEKHAVACPSALIGASNFFELAVAAAISLLGFQSGAAPATVVGVLTEVPVMLLVVKVVNASKGWYERGAASQRT
jgi:arsenate reductase